MDPNLDGNYRPDLKGLRLKREHVVRQFRKIKDGNYRPDLKGLRLFAFQQSGEVDVDDGNYRPDLKGLRLTFSAV